MKITFWHLLHAISFMAPLEGALFIGWKMSWSGLAVASVIGLAMGLCSFLGLHEVGHRASQHFFKLKSPVKQDIAFVFLYFSAVVWSYAVCGLSVFVAKSLLLLPPR